MPLEELVELLGLSEIEVEDLLMEEDMQWMLEE